MKHIQEWKIFETRSPFKYWSKKTNEDTWNPRINPGALMEDEVIHQWLQGVRILKFEGSPAEDNSSVISTPYGEEIEAEFTHNMEPERSEEIWIEKCFCRDDWGILYEIPGSNDGGKFDYVEDVEWDWEPEKIEAKISWGFDPINFIEKAALKDPMIASRVYQLLPRDKKEQADEVFSRLDINTHKLSKGSKLLRGIGGI